MAPGDEHPDPEGITLLPDGSYAVSAEGTAREPRLPPSVNIYGRYGDFVRSLKIPDKFVPDPTGQQTKGARGNAGFESLTLTPDGKRLFTAAETPLVQDGEPASLEAGTDTRVLELVARHETFEPAREFVYRPRAGSKADLSRRALPSTAWSSCWRSTTRRCSRSNADSSRARRSRTRAAARFACSA